MLYLLALMGISILVGLVIGQWLEHRKRARWQATWLRCQPKVRENRKVVEEEGDR